MTITDLIARLEQATEGDRDLDTEIAALCHSTDDPRMAAFENGRDYPDLYTSSLDAALTLVPHGFWWAIHQFAGATGSGKDAFNVRFTHADPAIDGKAWGTHQSAPIAMTIACLRAMSFATEIEDYVATSGGVITP